MNSKCRTLLLLALLLGFGLVAASPAAAYVGPGAGLAIIGAAIAFVGGIFVAVAGFVWYPVKRLWKVLGRGKPDPVPDEE